MSTENDTDSDNTMRMFTRGRDTATAIDSALAATEAALVNTERFLSQIQDPEAGSRRYVEDVRARMEDQLEDLRNRKKFLLRDSPDR